MSDQNHRSHAEAEIIQLENEIFSAIKTRDSKLLDKILADDFVYRSPASGEQTKADFLQSIAAIPVEILAVWSEDMKVNVYSDVAVMTGTQKAKVRVAEGKEAIGATAFTDIFVKRHGKWLLALAHGVELPSLASDN